MNTMTRREPSGAASYKKYSKQETSTWEILLQVSAMFQKYRENILNICDKYFKFRKVLSKTNQNKNGEFVLYLSCFP